jgi:hypothetical protein
VAGKQHRAALFTLLLDRVLEGGFHQRVQPGGRLVHDDKVHIRRQRGHDRDLLPVALGVCASLLPGIEVEAFDQFLAAALIEPAPQPPQKVDHLTAGKIGPEVDVAGDVGEPPVQGRRVLPWVTAEQADVALVCVEQTEEHADGEPDGH